jgi:hypothetical protein
MLQLKPSLMTNPARAHFEVLEAPRVHGARPTEHVGDIFVTVANGALAIEVQRIDESATGPVVVTVR